jgi:hypothetical protein
MPTVQEKAQSAAKAVQNAVVIDGFTKKASIDESAVRKSYTAAALKRINTDLSASLERSKIEAEAARLLKVKPDDFRRMLKEAGNDNYLQLITLIDQLTGS